MTLRLVQLYPTLLGISGDAGNVEVLATRARLAGFEVEVVTVEPGDTAPGEADLIVIGNGPLSAIRTVESDLRARAGWLRTAVENGCPVLAVGGGAELLAEQITLTDGSRLDGLGLVPARVARTRERRVGYVVADTADGRLVGFEDHASLWSVDDAALAYGTVLAGNGGVDGGQETVRAGSVVATNLQGPVLPLNPWLADLLLAAATARRGLAYATGEAHAAIDAHADAARADIERLATGKRFTAIQLR